MKRLKFYISVLFAFALLRVICGPLNAAIYYVASASSTPAGSNSNAGSQSAPWLTLQYAVNHMACGDTLMVVADGNYVAGDANLPYFANCGQISTVQSSKLNLFRPVGYQTIPTKDSSNYGKLTFTNQGISAAPQVYNYDGISFAELAFNTSTNTVTLMSGLNSGYATLANGMQLEMELSYQGVPDNYYAPISPPGGLSLLTHYYVINCGPGPVGSLGYPQTCGQPNSQLQLAASPGGSAVSITACATQTFCAATVSTAPTGSCSLYNLMQYNTTDGTPYRCTQGLSWAAAGFYGIWAGWGVGASTSANTLTIPVNFGSGSLANNMPVAFSSAGINMAGTLPAPLQGDATYYVTGLSGNVFSVSALPGGSVIPLTSVGTGMINISSVEPPSNWAFRGLEMLPAAGAATGYPNYFFLLGNGSETSTLAMPHHFEIDRSYLHDNPATLNIVHAIVDNAMFVTVHDSWVIGANDGEAQALTGCQSLGPTTISNNFLEAAGEVSLYGGCTSAYVSANQNKLFQGNYFYKPPIWKHSSGTTTPSGSTCLADSTDPTHAGGEFYLLNGTTWYQCNPTGTGWAVAASAPTCYYPVCLVKDMTEHKNGRYFTYFGNLYNYSFAIDQSGQMWNNSMELGAGGPGFANDHITMMNNAGYNVFTMSNTSSQCFPSLVPCPNVPGYHAKINNLVVVNALTCGTSFAPGCSYQNWYQDTPIGTITSLTPSIGPNYWNHNTIWTPDTDPFSTGAIAPMYAAAPPGVLCLGYPPSPTPYSLTYFNNITGGDWGGDCYGAGALIQYTYANSTWRQNVLKKATGNYSGVTGTNVFTPTSGVISGGNSSVGYVSGIGINPLNYGLTSSSPYSAANGGASFVATDGSDVGADVQTIAMHQWGAQNGKPVPSVNVAPGSVNAIVTFQAPALGACTALLYPGTGPHNGTPLSTTTDTITSGLSKEIDLLSLTASTQYQFVVTCAGDATWIVVGSFATNAAGGTSKTWQISNASGLTWYKSSSPSMSSPTLIGSGATIQASVSAGGLTYVSPLCSSGAYCGVQGVNAP